MKLITLTYIAITLAALTLGACANMGTATPSLQPSMDVSRDSSPAYMHYSDPRHNSSILNAGGQ